MPPNTGYPAGLTQREVNIMRLIAEGHQRQEIARALHFTEATVGNDLRAIRQKLHSRTTAEAVVRLVRARVI